VSLIVTDSLDSFHPFTARMLSSNGKTSFGLIRKKSDARRRNKLEKLKSRKQPHSIEPLIVTTARNELLKSLQLLP
jgi:hypothetical protein